MELILDSDISHFSQATKSFLHKDKLLHSMILGMVGRYMELQKPMALLPRLVNQKGELVAMGIQTESDRALILPKLDLQEAEYFAELLAAHIESFPGVNGPVPSVEVFARKWAEIKKRPAALITNLRLFELRELISPPAPSGSARLAEERDRDIIYQWLIEFHDEAVPHDPKPVREEFYKGIDNGIRLGRYFIWEDQGEAVAFVGSSRETESEKWIAPVYTPKSLRGRGYASALTASVSQKILESGKVGVLFTDQDNPTSNSIYQKMGYRPIADFKHIGFESTVRDRVS